MASTQKSSFAVSSKPWKQERRATRPSRKGQFSFRVSFIMLFENIYESNYRSPTTNHSPLHSTTLHSTPLHRSSQRRQDTFCGTYPRTNEPSVCQPKFPGKYSFKSYLNIATFGQFFFQVLTLPSTLFFH